MGRGGIVRVEVGEGWGNEGGKYGSLRYALLIM